MTEQQTAEGISVGFVGVGRMGGRMARRIVAAGIPLRAFDVDAAAATATGGVAVATAAEAARGADLILCSLPGPATVEQAILGEDGVLATARPGAVVVDMTTSDAPTSRRAAEACRAKDVRYVDAPVSRGVTGAESGTLAVLAGGDAEDLDRARPVLELLATDIVHVGPVGAGQIAKLCNNMLAAVHAVALGEVLTAGVKAGIGLPELVEAISSASGTSFILEHYLPRGLFTEERPTTFALSLMCKDLGLFMDTAAPRGVSAGAALPVSSLVQQLYAAASASGRDDADYTAVAELYEGLSGVDLRLAPTAGAVR